MNAGLTGPGRAIYTIYSPMCHQMASRSFFLFGEQPAYPRELAGTSLNPLESYTDTIPEFENVSASNWAQFFLAARRGLPLYDVFVEGAKDGFKVAVSIIPYLVAMLVAIGIVRASGALDFLLDGVRWVVSLIGIDTRWVEGLPTALMRPLLPLADRCVT